MTLDQLRIFVAVAECEHMTRASEVLQLTQSTVSGAVHALEERHQVKLFNRIGRRIELSQEGRIFLEQARNLLRQADAAERALTELAGLERGVLLVHASQTIASYWLPKRLVQFHREHPAISVTLGIGNTEQVAAAVTAGDAELGFVEGPVDESNLVAEQVDTDRLVLVVGASHDWARRDSVTSGDLLATPWVLRERGSGTRSAFEHALTKIGIEPSQLQIELELPSNEAVRAAVEAGAGATAISYAVAESGIVAGRLHPLAFDLLERPFSVLVHRQRSRSAVAAAFLAAVC